jgi:hypothetical protein
MGRRAIAIAVGLVLLGVLAGGCVDNASQAHDARGYNSRTDTPARGAGPSSDMGPAARDMPGKGRGSETPRGK